MSYLDYMKQTLNTPIANYHECILGSDDYGRESIQSFFNSQNVQEVWSKISKLDSAIYSLEREKRRAAYKERSISKKNSSMFDTVASLTHLYSLVEIEKKRYEFLKHKALPSALPSSAVPEDRSSVSQIPRKKALEETASSEKRDISQRDDIDYLLSMSGMFSSDDSQSDTVNEDIANYIAEKHEADNA